MKNCIEELKELAVRLQTKYITKEDITFELSELLYKVKQLSTEIENYKDISNNNNTAFEITPYDVDKVAYFLARYEHKDLTKQRITKAIEEFSTRLGVKPSTLRNKRDIYAPFVYEIKDKEIREAMKTNPNLKYKEPRNGWKIADRDLSPIMQETYDECSVMSHDQLLAEVKEILRIK